MTSSGVDGHTTVATASTTQALNVDSATHLCEAPACHFKPSPPPPTMLIPSLVGQRATQVAHNGPMIGYCTIRSEKQETQWLNADGAWGDFHHFTANNHSQNTP